MKSIRTLTVILFLILVTVNGYSEETIRLASGEWAPYQSKNLKHAGYVSRIVSEAFALEGIRAEFDYFPWKRSYILAERGELDGTFLWFGTPERRTVFYISDPIIDVKYVFFHMKSLAFKWERTDDLKKDYIIGCTLGYDYGESFQKAEKKKKIRVIRKYNDEKNLALLFAGKIQLFPCELESGIELIRKIIPQDQQHLVTYHPTPLKADPHHLLLSKQIKENKEIIKRFNAGLKKLKESGKVAQYTAESRRGDYK